MVVAETSSTLERRVPLGFMNGLKTKREDMLVNETDAAFRPDSLSVYEEAEALVSNRVLELVCRGSLLQRRHSSDASGVWGKELNMKDETAMAAEVFEDIKTHYESPQRFYHTLMHVADLLRQSDEARRTGKPFKLNNPDIIDWAILFHDIIYTATSGTNEEDSAVYFRRWAAKCSEESSEYPLWMPEPSVSKICHYIIETKKHNVALSPDKDLQFFIDIDMSILGRENSEEYMQYCDKVRLEYSHLSDNEWREGRSNFLKSTLDKGDFIFASPEIRSRLEVNAKRNMQLELEKLENI